MLLFVIQPVIASGFLFVIYQRPAFLRNINSLSFTFFLNMRTSITAWLEKPIWNPSDHTSKRTIAVTISCFVLVVLLLLEPFGLGYAITDFLFLGTIFGYGILAFFTVYIAEVWLKPQLAYFNAEYMSRGRIIVWYLAVTLVMSFVNFSYYRMISVVLADRYQFQSQTLLVFVYKTVAVGLLPSIGLILYFSRDISFRKKLYEQSSIENEYLQIADENKKTIIRVLCSDLVLLEARSNYVQVIYREGGEIRKELIRTTLRRLSEQLSQTPVQRCHQSYLINTTQVNYFSKSTRKKLVYLAGIKDPVPVSEKYLDVVEQALSTYATHPLNKTVPV